MGEQSTVANMTRILPGYEQETLIKESALPDYQAASLEVTGDRLVDGMREISLHLKSEAAAEYINLQFAPDAVIAAASVNGFPVDIRDISKMGDADSDELLWWRWRLYGLPQQGAKIVVTLETTEPLRLRIVEVNYGMPPDAPSRPADSMPRPYTWSDSVVAFQTISLE